MGYSANEIPYRVEEALELVLTSSAITRTRDLARKFAKESREAIKWLPDSPSSRALLELPEFVLSRLY